MQVSRFRSEGPLPCPTFFTHMKTCFWLSAPAGVAGGGGGSGPVCQQAVTQVGYAW